MQRSQIKTYPPYFSYYISLVTEEDLLSALDNSLVQGESFLKSIPSEKFDFKYAPNKWSIGQLILHLMDAERIFAYRALCIARGEKNNLPGFDENDFAQASRAEIYQPSQLIDDYGLIRKNSIHLFKSFAPEVYSNIGSANGYEMELGAILCAILGHEKHHFNILKERYIIA